MSRPLAAALSMLLPGTGQLAAGRRRRAAALLLATVALGVLAVLAVRADGLASVDRRLLAVVLAANALLLAFRLFAVVDAWRLGRGSMTRAAVAALALVLAATAVPHVAAAYVAVRGYTTLETVFADEKPTDVLPAYGLFVKLEPPKEVELPLLLKQNPALASKPLAGPWTTILLLGTDEGPGNWGARTDTMILVALEHRTGRGAAFGIPRNLVDVPLADGEKFRQPLNALYAFARARPDRFPSGGDDPGATALKQAVSRLLGLRVDYYALVDLLGFADLVDALGGVTIQVKERLVDSVTRPAWGEPKPRIDVHPGQTVHMRGRLALAYVRSRKTSSDYTRMARQRCFLAAMAAQLDAYRVLRNFGKLTHIVEQNVRTDVPLDRMPSLVRLVTRLDSRKLVTETFGLEYIARRRKSDNFPVPNLARMRATVRSAVLEPLRREQDGGLADAASTC